MASPALPVFVFTLIASLASVCLAGSYCGEYNYKYCSYGCCGNLDRDCCIGTSVGLIVGLCVGGGVLIFIAIIVICICRRRRYNDGFIYRGQAQPAYVVQQTTTQGGVVTTTGVQPGVMYPPQPYPGYPVNYGYGNPAPQYPPQASAPYAAEPPSYESLQNPSEGQNNPAFDSKN